MHFITCENCGKIKRTIKKQIICAGCKKSNKLIQEDYDYNQDIRIIPPINNEKIYKFNKGVNVFIEIGKAAIFKDYKMKHKYELLEEKQNEL